ncbi:unnamed protein product [Meloidogyne enterolobii]|uniref:Uncharacterized protein n=1 Tax=Meloidogyne enterolobii TaxID=390850 RepID=A0ACB0ZS01_MELEN
MLLLEGLLLLLLQKGIISILKDFLDGVNLILVPNCFMEFLNCLMLGWNIFLYMIRSLKLKFMRKRITFVVKIVQLIGLKLWILDY